jgi:two-component system C4-dicarboxylate transport sensor histidine kinase DctB
VLFGLACTALIGLLTAIAGHMAQRQARIGLVQRSEAAADLHSAVLRSELEKYSSLPIVLTEDHDVREALRAGGSQTIRALNMKLEGLSERTRAAVIYVLDHRGVTIAASNWRRGESFVGTDYSFRPYFRDAMAGRTAEHFALGAVSGKPGLFFARPVEGEQGPSGVVVIKVEFDELEREWRGSDDPAFVTGPDKVVLLTSVPDWRFHTTTALAEGDRARLRRSLQYGRGGLEPLPLRSLGSGEVEVTGPGPRGRFVEATAATARPGWTLHLLTPADREINAAVNSARSLALLLGLLLTLAAGMWLRRSERAAARAAAEERTRADLEARVQERTLELRIANDRLVREMAERRRVEAGRQALQDELVQASKLATLGQIAAGVAHEINQPVAAIRTYADNAAVFLDRADTRAARTNLSTIAGLTEKIGLITDELRAFSRKTSARAHPIGVEEAIAGAVLLIGARARELGVQILREGSSSGVHVLAERVRLEQVLMNLLQNALEALTDRPGGIIRLGVQTAGRRVRIIVADNGPGLAPAVAGSLFTPFVTTKPTGLGLGLVISRDLVTEFGGELTLTESEDGGARFVVSLKKAA